MTSQHLPRVSPPSPPSDHRKAAAKVAYFVPEFPGQTHSMFWSELQELRRSGIAVDLVSTRRGPASTPHLWGEQASQQTTYLFPLDVPSAVRALRYLVLAGPRRWTRMALAVARSGRPWPSRLRLLGLLVIAAELADVARTRGWEHVHVHSCADAADIARLARALGGPTYSLTLHGSLADYGPDQHAKWSGAAFAVVITEQLRQEAERQLRGALPPKVRVTGMGVDVHDFDVGRQYAPWSGTGEARIFSCGRLNPAKGHLDLLQAVHDLRQDGIDARLVIAGEDEEEGRGYRRVVEQRIRQLGLAGDVVLLGAVAQDVVRRQLEQAHVFALASTAEPLGVAIMEAMATATPVVATAAGGVPELVRDGVDGLLVQPGAPSELAQALRRLLRDASLATRLSAAGPRRTAERAARGSSAATLRSLLDEVQEHEHA